MTCLCVINVIQCRVPQSPGTCLVFRLSSLVSYMLIAIVVIVVVDVYLIYFILVLKIPRVKGKVKCVKNEKLEYAVVG